MVLNSIRFDLALALALTLAQYCYRVYCLFSVGNVRQKLSLTNKLQISSHLAPNNLDSVFYYLFYFWYYLWALLLSLILFILFDTIYESYCIISANFYLYLRTFSKRFSISTKLAGF